VLWTRLGGGNEATALLVTLISTATSWLVTTLWLTATTGTAVALDAGGMMLDLLVYLVAPVAAGQLCRAAPPLLAVATRHRAALGVLSQVLILGILLRASAQAGLELAGGGSELGWGAVLQVAGFSMALHLGVLAAGWETGRWLGFDRGRRIAIAFASSQKTLPVALLVFDQYFQRTYPLAILSILCYHAGQLLWDTAIAARMARGAGSDE
jgi:predicted Na+-dependent transporter